jgi:alpha-N-acetylglucosamine transferase
VTNADYALGARALAQSLASAPVRSRYRGSSHRRGRRGSELARARISVAGWCAPNLLATSGGFQRAPCARTAAQDAPFTKGRKPAFHSPLDNFCKLRLWQLTEYEACVFIDADALV